MDNYVLPTATVFLSHSYVTHLREDCSVGRTTHAEMTAQEAKAASRLHPKGFRFCGRCARGTCIQDLVEYTPEMEQWADAIANRDQMPDREREAHDSAVQNADDTAAERGFSTTSQEWYETYVAGYQAMLDGAPTYDESPAIEPEPYSRAAIENYISTNSARVSGGVNRYPHDDVHHPVYGRGTVLRAGSGSLTARFGLHTTVTFWGPANLVVLTAID